jgi:hypothetical protein
MHRLRDLGDSLACSLLAIVLGSLFVATIILLVNPRFPVSVLLLSGGTAFIPTWTAALYIRRRSRRRSQQAADGRCARCGYDLRAHATGERRPECGTAVS